MKYILAILILTSVAFALHDPADSVIVNIQADGSTGTTPNASWGTTRAAAGSVGRSSFSTASDTGVVTGKISTNFAIYRTILWSDTLSSGYPDSFAVAVGNASSLREAALSICATNAAYYGGCTGQIMLYMQNPLVANAWGANQSTASAAVYFDDIFTKGTWVKFDSIPIDTTTFGLSDTLRLRFKNTSASVLNMISESIAGRGNNAVPTLGFSILTCFDADSVAPTTGADTLTFRVDFMYNEMTGTTYDPQLSLYWTEVEPVTASGSSTWPESWRNASNSLWRETWGR